ncbi:MAG TPA: TIGR01777 family oxidoreductase [Candidatus Saccharimonadales bacterium]|nr:TIGR01777 family oxidoreductase [Candidatus Saccharimonadales bacterium]
MNKKRVVLAGGSGFLGQTLARLLLMKNYEVAVLARSPQSRDDGIQEVAWNGKTLDDWVQYVDGADALVNLAGRSVNCRHTPENVREIIESRINSVNAVAAAIHNVAHPPRVWVQAGSLAIYGDLDDRWCEEGTPSGQGEMVETCRLWETAFMTAPLPSTRRVLLRIGLVLARDSGALSVLGRLTKWFLGGEVGCGQQYVSWIHWADMNQMFMDSIEQDNVMGVFNATSPNPVTNSEFMTELRRALRRPWCPSAPTWAVRFGSWLLKTDPSLALTGRRCAPKRFLRLDFKFQFSELRAALKNIYG